MKIKRFLGTALFLVILALGLWLLYPVFAWKDTSGDYFSSLSQLHSMEKETVDVAFFGPSAVYCAVNPAVIWQDAGIASFNAAISGMDSHVAPVYVRELCKEQSPKLVVISSMLFTIDYYAIQGNIYRNTILLNNGKEYVDAVNRIVPDNDTTGGDIRDYWLRWPIIHGRYKELKKNDFVPVRAYEYALGYVYSKDIHYTPALGEISVNRELFEPISERNREFVDELMELSGEYGFRLLFLNLPWTMYQPQRAVVNGVEAYLDQKGIDHLDLNYCIDDMGLDFAHEFGDEVHALTEGATKISYYLGDYLREKYDLPDHRGDERYGVYEKSFELFEHQKLGDTLMTIPEDDRFFRKVGKYDGLIACININGPTEALSQGAREMLRGYGMSEEAISEGGAWFYRDGELIMAPELKQTGLRVNEDKFIHVSGGKDGVGWHNNVYDGRTRYIFDDVDSCIVLIYDEILDKMIDSRTIE